MDKNKILLIAEKGEIERYRTKRIIEEAEKADCVADLICSNETSILASEAIFDGQAIDFASYGFAYSLGNSCYHQYLLLLAESFGVPIWPGAEHFNYSDKFFEGIFFNSINVPIPRTILLSGKSRKRVESLAREIGGFPCVLKKVSGSEGRYVDLANSVEDVFDFVQRMPQGITGKKNILMQEYIAESKGTDFRVYCVGSEVLGAIKRKSQNENDFRANISLGGKAHEIKLDEPLVEYSRTIMEEGKLQFAGIDFIKSSKGYLAIEINTSADFQGFEKATGINIAKKIVEKIINQL